MNGGTAQELGPFGEESTIWCCVLLIITCWSLSSLEVNMLHRNAFTCKTIPSELSQEASTHSKGLRHSTEGSSYSNFGFKAISDLSDFNRTLAQLLTSGNKLTKLAPTVWSFD